MERPDLGANDVYNDPFGSVNKYEKYADHLEANIESLRNEVLRYVGVLRNISVETMIERLEKVHKETKPKSKAKRNPKIPNNKAQSKTRITHLGPPCGGDHR